MTADWILKRMFDMNLGLVITEHGDYRLICNEKKNEILPLPRNKGEAVIKKMIKAGIEHRIVNNYGV